MGSGVVTSDVSEWLDTILDSVDVTINQGSEFYEPVAVNNEQTLIDDSDDMPIFILSVDKANMTKTHVG